MSERLTKEREASIRIELQVAMTTSEWGVPKYMLRDALAELDAVRAERNELMCLPDIGRALTRLVDEDLDSKLAQAREEGRREGAEQERARLATAAESIAHERIREIRCIAKLASESLIREPRFSNSTVSWMLADLLEFYDRVQEHTKR